MVNYVTKRPKRERFGEAYVTGGSFNHKEVGFDFGDNLTGDETLSYRLTGKFKDSDAEYDYSRDDEKFIMGGLTWRPSDATNLTVIFDHLHRNGVPGSGGHPVGTRAFPCLIESAGFANQLLSDSSYLPMEVGRYVASPFH